MKEPFATIVADLEAAVASGEPIIHVDHQSLRRILRELKRARRAERFWRAGLVDAALLTADT